MFVDELRRRLQCYLKQWRPGERGADAAMLWIVARYLETIATRLNLAPDKNLLAFLEMAGIRRIPPQPARAPIVFKLNNLAENGRVPEGTRIAAPPTPDRNDQLVFETERSIGFAAAQIQEIACLHPGRDEFASYVSALKLGQPFQLFAGMQMTEHSFYLAHDRLLQFAGQVRLKVDFDLAIVSSQRLHLIWEYWDGEVWRAFANVLEQCGGSLQEDVDGTDGLTRSGTVLLKSDCTDNQRQAVNGQEAFWIRGRLLDPLPADPTRTLPAVDNVKLRTELSNPLRITGKVNNVDRGFRIDPYIKGNISDNSIKPQSNITVVVQGEGKNADGTKTEDILSSTQTNGNGDYALAFELTKTETVTLNLTVKLKNIPQLECTKTDLPKNQFLQVDFWNVDFSKTKGDKKNIKTGNKDILHPWDVTGSVFDKNNVSLIGTLVVVEAVAKDANGNEIAEDNQKHEATTDEYGRYRVLFQLKNPNTKKFDIIVSYTTPGNVKLRHEKKNQPIDKYLQIDFQVDFSQVTGDAGNPKTGSRVTKNGPHIKGKVIDQDGLPLQGLVIHASATNANNGVGNTNALGEYEIVFEFVGNPPSELDITVTLTIGAMMLQYTETDLPVEKFLQLDFLVNILAPASFDKAFSNGENIDLNKAFCPFGQHPQPGSTFYFTNEVLFSKPGSLIQIFMQRVNAPHDESGVRTIPQSEIGMNSPAAENSDGVMDEPLKHSVVWEYWNGRYWAVMPHLTPQELAQAQGESTPEIPYTVSQPKADLDSTEVIGLRVPNDFERAPVNGEEGYWMRVRLVGGGFGFHHHVTWLDQKGNTNEFTYVIDSPPVLSTFRFGFLWQSPPEFPERVLALNDFRFSDYTTAARVPGTAFSPFARLADQTPATYCGFDKKLPVDYISLFLAIDEEHEADPAPELLWEYWNGASWRHLLVEDETGHLSRPGTLSFIGPEDAEALARFGTALYWIRGRRREDGTPFPTRLQGAFLNSIWASQLQTHRNESLGASNGLANQFFRLRQTPVLENEVIDVRELAGKIAEVEYPMLQEKVKVEDLRVIRDARNRVTEVWVRWQAQPHFHFSGANDRHYLIDRVQGRIFFGDGLQGRIPPPSALIMAREYRSGGGRLGNVAARAISQLISGVPGVQEVFNPLPAEGGADAEKPEQIHWRGPQTLRHRGRALSVPDYEVMAREASPEVAWVRVFANMDMKQVRRPGYVKVMILPDSLARRPWPSFGLRERVRQYLIGRASASIASEACIWVTGPAFFPVGIDATVVPMRASEAGIVEQRVRAALEEFLHPLRGGPNAKGWELGRDVYLSDVAAIIERLEGVDCVESLMLKRAGAPQGEHIDVPEDCLVVAGEVTIKMKLLSA